MADLAGDAAATRAFWPAGGAGLPRVLPPAPVRACAPTSGRYGVPGLRGTALIGEVERSGLTGRGGAAYPAGTKLRAVRERAGLRGAVVIANGMESEPASAKDAALLARAPHLVLDGIALAAEATSARAAYLCVRRQAQADALAAAIAERAGYDPVPVQLALVPERYVSSAESSLVRYLNGGPALPGFTPPRPFERGVRGRPTLVSNVETLANLALISRHGADWFRSAGTAVRARVGAGHGVRRGAAPGGLRDRLRHAGTGRARAGRRQRRDRRRAGGAGRRLLRQLAAGRGRAGHPRRPGGAARGRGVVRRGHLPRPAGRGCGLAETARVVRYLAGQSAGQCGPCLNGLPAIADALEQVAFGAGGSRHARRRTAARCAGCATCSDSSRAAVPATCPTAWPG